MKLGTIASLIYLTFLQILNTSSQDLPMDFLGLHFFLLKVSYYDRFDVSTSPCCRSDCLSYMFWVDIYYEIKDNDNYNSLNNYTSIYNDLRGQYYLYKMVYLNPDKIKKMAKLIFSMRIECNYNKQIQDSWTIPDLAYYPYTGSAFGDFSGKKHFMMVSFAIKGNCPGKAGKFCYKTCYEDETKYCDVYTGDQYCKNSRFGDDCELEVSACNSNPCVNGICKDVGTSFTCFCFDGFRGLTCNTVACTVSKCKNGLCQDDLLCHCFDGYVGSNCETLQPSSLFCNGGGLAKISTDHTDYKCECYDDSAGQYCEYRCGGNCKNGGKCISRRNMGFCKCAPGYTGKNCEFIKRKESCDGINCQNGGRCEVVGLNDFKCQCPEFWYGSYCEISVCDTDYCYHGTCLSNYGCLCFDGYSGSRCETINDQTYNECMNGGMRTTDLGFLRCICNEKESTGTFCEYKCAKLCVYGKCEWTDSVIKCVCEAEYTGDDCSIQKTQKICDTHPCLNDGLCIELPGYNFECHCNKYWSGELCEQSTCEITECVKGMCIDGVGCKCINGYNGTSCKIPFCSKDHSICARSEECVTLGSRLSCNCDRTKYFGSSCEHECRPACSIHGICNLMEGELKCNCFAGYVGPQCDSLLNDPIYLYIIYACAGAIVILIIAISIFITLIVSHRNQRFKQAMKNAMFDASGAFGISKRAKVKTVDDTYGTNINQSWAIGSK